MPPTRIQREANRERQARFRAKNQSSGMVELRALVPRALADELQLAMLFVPNGTKDSLIRVALEAYLSKHGEDAKKIILLIRKFWGPILNYQLCSPALLRPGQTIVLKGRTYSFEESVKLGEIRAAIVGFFRARGIPHPESVITSIHVNHFSGK